MSDEAAIFACSRHFLNCSWSCLTGVREDKVAKSDLATYFSKVISARDISIWDVSEESISTGDTYAGDIYVDAGQSNIDSCLSIKYGPIDIILNFVEQYDSSIIIDLACILKKI